MEALWRKFDHGKERHVDDYYLQESIAKYDPNVVRKSMKKVHKYYHSIVKGNLNKNLVPLELNLNILYFREVNAMNIQFGYHGVFDLERCVN